MKRTTMQLAILSMVMALPVYAAEVESTGSNSDGNILIWFLCAVAFLKVSQNLDSLLGAIGIQQPKRGSLMSELLIAGRAIKMAASLAAGSFGIGKAAAGTTAAKAAGAGLSGLASGAVGKAAMSGITHNGSGSGISNAIGAATYAASARKGGAFASEIVGAVARGNMASTGSMKGEQAAQALSNYLGIQPIPPEAGNAGESIPSFRDVEIGGGRITGFESAAGAQPRQFAMYHTGQYMRPNGEFEMVKSADGESWYKQYAAPTVEKTPYTDPTGKIRYNEKIVDRMPQVPRRKDKI